MNSNNSNNNNNRMRPSSLVLPSITASSAKLLVLTKMRKQESQSATVTKKDEEHLRRVGRLHPARSSEGSSTYASATDSYSEDGDHSPRLGYYGKMYDREESARSLGFREMSVDEESCSSPRKLPARSSGCDTEEDKSSGVFSRSSRRLIKSLSKSLSIRSSSRKSMVSEVSSVPAEAPESFEAESPQVEQAKERASLRRYYSLEDDASSESGFRKRSSSDRSISYFFPVSQSPPSSPTLTSSNSSKHLSLQRTRSNSQLKSIDDAKRAIASTVVDGIASSTKLAKSVLHHRSSQEEVDSPPALSDEEHRNLLLKVQFCTLVNDYEKMPEDVEDHQESPGSKRRKASRIARMFLREGSLFYLKDIPEYHQKRVLEHLEFEHLSILKQVFVEELATHKSIEQVLQESGINVSRSDEEEEKQAMA